MEPFVWPPPYQVRISRKARYARLRALPDKGLEVVLPLGLDPSVAAHLVENSREWVTNALRNLGAAHAGRRHIVPESIALHGNERVLPVFCLGEEDAGGEGEGNASVRLQVCRQDNERAVAALQEWVLGYAQAALTRETTALAAQYCFSFSSLRFRRQKSRWGSCSSRGGINLNICLVFLPRELCRHVILHELAHTEHCNHGQGFWKVLFAAEPNALALDKRLRRAWLHVPAWMWA